MEPLPDRGKPEAAALVFWVDFDSRIHDGVGGGSQAALNLQKYSLIAVIFAAHFF